MADHTARRSAELAVASHVAGKPQFDIRMLIVISVVLCIAGKGPIDFEQRTKCARLLVGAQEFGLVFLGNAVRAMAIIFEEPVDDHFFAAKAKLLRQIEGAEKGVMPPPPDLRKVAAVAGNDDVEDGECSDRIGMMRCDREGDGAAPVMSDKMKLLEPEMIDDQSGDVRSERFLV